MKAKAAELEVMPPQVNLPAVAGPAGEIIITGSVDRIRQYASMAERMGRASLAMQVMAGMELAKLRSDSPYRQGGLRPKNQRISEGSEQSGHDGRIALWAKWPTWDEFLRHELGLARRTADRWMLMAEAVKPRLKKLAGIGALVAEILEKPIAELSIEEAGLLTQAVSRIADGKSQLDFLEELGLVKKPGNSQLGGATVGGGRKPADETKVLEASRADWAVVQRQLASIGTTFSMLPDAEIEAQNDFLEAALSARREWIETPAAKRGEATLARCKEILS